MRDIQKTKIPRHSADRLSNKANSFIDMPFLNGHEAMTIYSLKQAFRLNDRSLMTNLNHSYESWEDAKSGQIYRFGFERHERSVDIAMQIDRLQSAVEMELDD